MIRSYATVPGPPRRFSRIRLGRHEFATLFRHGLFIPFLFDLFLFSYLGEQRILLPPLPSSPSPPLPFLPLRSRWKSSNDLSKNDPLPLCKFSVEGKLALLRSMGTDGFGDGPVLARRCSCVSVVYVIVRRRSKEEL